MKTSDIGFTAKMGESNTRFEIWFRKRKPNDTIILEATNPDVKEAWVEDISRILWKQALRNRGIPGISFVDEPTLSNRLFIELRMAEMAEMGIGNKPCLDIRPSQDQISDRSISYAQLAKGIYNMFQSNVSVSFNRLLRPKVQPPSSDIPCAGQSSRTAGAANGRTL